MQTKFESKSNRVKGLCFHPIRPWVLSSLHNGAIQMFDYRNKCLIHTFEEHDGPVRGVDFHMSQPLFVSGGDDYKIKVWNYKLKRCLFTLLGHLDYVRTVKFHSEQPWILSASDDQTIRLWNWQSRSHITTLTGHNHYVMSAFFHPQDALIVSASLDNSVRVWDISPILKNKPSDSSELGEIFSNNEVSVKFTLEGHDRGVNWACFHNSLPLIVSGADDRQIKIWRMSESNAWEVDTLKGHTNNVSSVGFHPSKDYIISNAEDRSIKIWDMSRRICLQTYKRENDRFWVLATHPTRNLVAAGHDSGMMVFTLDRERPPSCSNSIATFYIKESRYVRRHQYSNSAEELLLTLPKTTELEKGPKALLHNPFSSSGAGSARSSSKTKSETFLILYDKEKNASSGKFHLVTDSELYTDSCKSCCFLSRTRFVVLESNNRLIIRNFSNEIIKKINLTTSIANIGEVEDIFETKSSGRIILKTADIIYLYDISSKRIISQCNCPSVKRAFYSSNGQYLCLLTKSGLVLYNKSLEQISTLQEQNKIKTVLWCNSSTKSSSKDEYIIYSTLNHIKYLLINGDSGVLTSIEDSFYLTKAFLKTSGGSGESSLMSVYGLTNESKIEEKLLDITEINFKLSLNNKQFGKVMKIIKNNFIKNNLSSKSIIQYLQSKGYQQVALHFVKDIKIKFYLSISCSNLNIALDCCKNLNEMKYYEVLAKEALLQGKYSIVEMCYQKIKDFNKLQFLYLLVDEKEKLQKMYQIYENRNDVMNKFNLTLFMDNQIEDNEGKGEEEVKGPNGDKVLERIKILEQIQQYSLAYILASRKGYVSEAERLKGIMTEKEMKVPDMKSIDTWSKYEDYKPCQSLLTSKENAETDRNWPLREVDKGVVHNALVKGIDLMTEQDLVDDTQADQSEGEESLFDDDDDFLAQSSEQKTDNKNQNKDEDDKESSDEDKGWDAAVSDDELDFGNELQSPVQAEEDSAGMSSPVDGLPTNTFKMPSRGLSSYNVWLQNSSMAVDHAAAGNFQSCKSLLSKQLGISEFTPLLPKMRQIYLGSTLSLSTFPTSEPLEIFLYRNNDSEDPDNETQSSDKLKKFAKSAFTLENLQKMVTKGKALFSSGRLSECAKIFKDVLHSAVFTVVRIEEIEVLKGIIEESKEYSLAIKLETTRKQKEDKVEKLELALHFSNCKLEQEHRAIALHSATKQAFKLNNFLTSAYLSKKFLSLSLINEPKYAEKKKMCQKILKRSEMKATNEHELEFKKDEPFETCCESLTYIWSTDKKIKSPYCKAVAKVEFKERICSLDGISKLGVETLGLICSD